MSVITVTNVPVSTDDLINTFERLQAELDPPVRRYIRRLLGVHADDLAVDDLAQETFIALYRRLTRSGDPLPLGDAKPYTYGIARNLCYEELRRIERFGLALEDDHDQADDAYGIGYTVMADSSQSPENAAYWMLLNTEVQAAINKLPSAQRDALLLYCQAEMSYEEIAETLGVNVGTVKSRLHYAKRMLRGLVSAATVEAIESGDG